MRLDTMHARQAAGALGDHGADLAGLHTRLAPGGAAPPRVGRPWGADALGASFGAAYTGALDAALALMAAISAGARAAAGDLAAMVARTEQADSAAAAAFPQCADSADVSALPRSAG